MPKPVTKLAIAAVASSSDAVLMRTSWPLYLLLCGPLACVTIFVMGVITFKAGWSDWNNIETVGLLFLLVAGFYIYLASFSLYLTPQTITYRRIFKARKTIFLADIENWEVKYSIGNESSTDGLERLLIWTTGEKDPLIINVRLFSRAHYQKLFQVLKSVGSKNCSGEA